MASVPESASKRDVSSRAPASRPSPPPTRTRSAAALAILALVAGASQASCIEAQDGMRPAVTPAPSVRACAARSPSGRLCGCVYDVPRGIRELPNFEELPPFELLCVDRLAVTQRNGPPGFPGIDERFEWFGADLRGTFTVRDPARMSWRLISDDGARVFIDDDLVLNNDGRHHVRAVEATVQLPPGPHQLHVLYYQGSGPMALSLEVARSGYAYESLRLDRPL